MIIMQFGFHGTIVVYFVSNLTKYQVKSSFLYCYDFQAKFLIFHRKDCFEKHFTHLLPFINFFFFYL